MRNRWDHVTPEECQTRPLDNTSRYIYAQVSRWLRTDEPIHPEVAMEIAAWWHGPGRLDTAITAFSHTGAVMIHGIAGWDSYAGLGPDLGDAVREILAKSGGTSADNAALRALSAYVAEVEHHATRYRRSIWHGGHHRWMSTGTVDVDSCLTCGAEATLRPDSADGDYGSYVGGDGQPIIECTGRVDLVHGIPGERHCQDDNGMPCEVSAYYDGTGDDCEHIEHICNCNLCLG